jgi:hypothetical protein
VGRWGLGLAVAGAIALLSAEPATATPDRGSLHALRAGREGGSSISFRIPKALQRPGAAKDAPGKRCATCRGAGRAPVRGPAAPAVPEPTGALLFGLGALATRRLAGGRSAR